MSSPLESMLANNEIRLGLLFASVAKSAYGAADVDPGAEALEKGEAAYVRADWLISRLAQLAKEPLQDDLESLRSALNELSNNPAPRH